VSFDSILCEGILKNFVVFNELIVELGSPLDLGEPESAWVDGIHNLAVDGTCGALFDLS
jgi:hypothetical protein